MPLLTIPRSHTPRFDHFSIDCFLDETLREGAERCPFSVPAEEKSALVNAIMDTGIKDIVYGSGPQDPEDLFRILNQLEQQNRLAPDLRFSFIMLLNCHQPILPQFKKFPRHLKKHITISFGMISFLANKNIFEKTAETLRAWGFDSFRVSLLNNFNSGVDETTYHRITEEINRAVAAGIDIVRINDSLGTLYPEMVTILAANLRYDYPALNFCLHAHNDRGLGIQNALTSIYNGFNLIEGGFAGTGNRSGLPAIEILDYIFKEKKITIKGKYFDSKKVLTAACLTESTFLSVPDLYRPVSGYMVEQQNMGVANIPSYLGVTGNDLYFLNDVGLHDETIRKIIVDECMPDDKQETLLIEKFKHKLEVELNNTATRKRKEYEKIKESIKKFYRTDILYSDDLKKMLKELMS